ncbi:MAG TPA: glycosyl transferase family 1, partial [Thermaerobacter sp.]
MPAADASTPAAPVPRPHLGHLRRLTDDTGMIQHALGPVPNRATGYTADDNARALLVCLEAVRAGDREAEELAGTYLAFLA